MHVLLPSHGRLRSAIASSLLHFVFVFVLTDSACAQYGPYNTTLFMPSTKTVNANEPVGASRGWVYVNDASGGPYEESTDALNDTSEYTANLKLTGIITSTLTSEVRGVPVVASRILGVTATVVASNEFEDDANKASNRFYRGALIIGGGRRTENNLTSFVIPAGSGQPTFHLGGPSDLWGLQSLSPNAVRLNGFGFAVSIGGTDGGGSAQKARIYSVGLTVTWSMPTVYFAISPATGPAAGGTSIMMTSWDMDPLFIDLTPFTTAPSPLCRFGTLAVIATIINSTAMTCDSPAGSGGVIVKVSLDGEMFTDSGRLFTYDSPIVSAQGTTAPAMIATATTSITPISSAAASTTMETSAAPSGKTVFTSAGTTGGSTTGNFVSTSGSTTGMYVSSSSSGTTGDSKQAEAVDSATGGWVLILIVVCAIVCCLLVLAVCILLFRRHQHHPSVSRAAKRHASLEMDSDESTGSSEKVVTYEHISKLRLEAGSSSLESYTVSEEYIHN